MVRISLTQEQVRRIWNHLEPVQLCDPQGTVVCTLEPDSSKGFLAELKRRAASPGPWYTGEQVQARLQALQAEWDRTGGFDEDYMREFLARLNEANPGHMRPHGPKGG